MRRSGSTRAAGQTATEYMMVISVIVIAVVAGAYVFVPQFQAGVVQLSHDVSLALATGQVGGVGFARRGGAIGNGPTAAVGPTSANPGNADSGNGINPGSATANSDVIGSGSPSSAAAPLGQPQTPVTIGNGPVTAAHALDVHGPTGRVSGSQ